MRNPLLTIDKMCTSLKPGGIALIHCPNYTIPFDTHFDIFLVTRSKRVNEWLYRSKIDRYPRVWDELNFIRYIDVLRHLAHSGLDFTFQSSGHARPCNAVVQRSDLRGTDAAACPRHRHRLEALWIVKRTDIYPAAVPNTDGSAGQKTLIACQSMLGLRGLARIT